MIEGLRPYPAYRDSGVPWIGSVPHGWDIRRNGRLFAERKETGFPDLPILEVSLKTGVRIRDFESSKRKQIMGDRKSYKRAAKGDLAYNMMRMWQGAVGLVPVDGLISPAYVVARPLPGTVSAYFAYLYRTAQYMGEVNTYSRGIVPDRNRLYWDQFKQIPTPVPPPNEQAAIVKFIDHADRRIRRYIRAMQQIVNLLDEQKWAIIQHAVIRGLEPNVRFKPSGVEWMGDMPEHWEFVPLYRIGRFIRCRGGSKADDADVGVPRIRYGELYTRFEFGIHRAHGFVAHANAYKYTPIQRGDVLFALSGETVDDIGASAEYLSDTPGVCGGDVAVLRPTAALASGFLGYACRSRHAATQKALRCTGTTVKHIGIIGLSEVLIPVPPPDDQAAIVKLLDKTTNEADEALRRVRHGIDLLREYRTRLISDVTTGQLDVREAAAKLPDLDYAEPLEDADGLDGTENNEGNDPDSERPLHR